MMASLICLAIIVINFQLSSTVGNGDKFVREFRPSYSVRPRINGSEVVVRVVKKLECAVLCLADLDCPAFRLRGTNCELLVYSGNQLFKWPPLPPEVIHMQRKQVCISS